jgi:hypothetical protein
MVALGPAMAVALIADRSSSLDRRGRCLFSGAPTEITSIEVDSVDTFRSHEKPDQRVNQIKGLATMPCDASAPSAQLASESC